MEKQLADLSEAAEEVSKWAEHRVDGTYSVPQVEMDRLRAVLREINQAQEKK